MGKPKLDKRETVTRFLIGEVMKMKPYGKEHLAFAPDIVEEMVRERVKQIVEEAEDQ